MRRENSLELPHLQGGRRMPRRNAFVVAVPPVFDSVAAVHSMEVADRPPVTPQRQLSQYRGVPRNMGIYNGLHRLLFDLRER